MSKACILLADDDPAIRTVLTQFLTQEGYEVRATDSGLRLYNWVKDGGGQVVISDVMMPDADGLDLLPKLKAARPELPVLIMSAKNNVLTALRATQGGAFDYLPKPFDLAVLGDAVAKALEGQGAVARPSQALDLDLPIVGSSAPMQQVYRLIAKMAPTDLTVLIRGESGTGKELVAKVLHEFGARRTKPYVALNMAAIPADLVESELFGYERGAFTGAEAQKDGRFAQAQGGTMFLDEIGDMPLSIQTRLLRVLQEGTYTRVGGLKELRADVRIVAATHRDLEAMVRAGTFREDLFYRLNVVPLSLPPLRQRLEDLGELVPALAQGLASAQRPAKVFLPDAIAAMARYSWPGNVRELENFVQRLSAVLPQAQVDGAAVAQALQREGLETGTGGTAMGTAMGTAIGAGIESDGRVLSVDQRAHSRAHSPAHTLDAPPDAPPDAAPLDAWMEAAMAAFFEGERAAVPSGQLYTYALSRLERPLIERTLAATKGNQIQAAAILGLNRNTLRKKVADLGIRVVRGHGAARNV